MGGTEHPSPEGAVSAINASTLNWYISGGGGKGKLLCLQKQLPRFFLAIKSDLLTSPCILPHYTGRHRALLLLTQAAPAGGCGTRERYSGGGPGHVEFFPT